MTNRSTALLSIALMTALLAGCASNPAANDATAPDRHRHPNHRPLAVERNVVRISA